MIMAHVYRDPGRMIVSFKEDGDGKSQAGMELTGGVIVSLNGHENEQLLDIIMVHLPDMLELFIKKNSEYGAGDPTSGTVLGERGQFADIWRKIGKLKTGLWDGKEEQLTTESVDEILRDLIGHCFLALHMRAEKRRAGERETTEQHQANAIATLGRENAALRARLAHYENPDWRGRSQAVARSERSDSNGGDPHAREPEGTGEARDQTSGHMLDSFEDNQE